MNHNRWEDIWEDQGQFNEELRPDPATLSEDQKSALTSDLILHLENECHELLRHVKWRKHRRIRTPANQAMIREELVDIFKMWMSVAQVWEPDLSVLADAYWEKSAVVRRRHAEEFIRDSRQPSAVIDLDNVVADFTFGVVQWMAQAKLLPMQDATQAIHTRRFPQDVWKRHKVAFYNSGGFRRLPLMPGVQEFIAWCRAQGWNVVFLTSRPIDRYPNILTDTIAWMESYGLHADFVWWGADKPAKLEQEEVLAHVQLVVDDDKDFIIQYVESGVGRVFWLDPSRPREQSADGYWRVPSLSSVMVEYEHAHSGQGV